MFLEMSYNDKKIIASVFCHSLSQNNVDFESFISPFEQLLNDKNKRKQSLSVITGAFNVRSSYCWSNDINTTEGSKLFSLTSSNEFPQLRN